MSEALGSESKPLGMENKLVGRRRVAWTLASAVALATLGAVLYRLPRPSSQRDVPTYDIVPGTFVHEVSAHGNLQAARAIGIGVPAGVPSPLKIAWTVPDGSAVRRGEVVVRFEPTDFEKRLLDGESDRASAEAKADRERALTALADRTRQRSAALSALELAKAREFQAKDPEIFSRNQIIESGIDEELSEARRAYADEARQIEASLSKNKLEQIAVERRQAAFSIQRAQKGLSSLELRAPEDGVILFERDWMGNLMKVGDSVWEGKTIASLPVLDQMQAEVFVLEADAGGLKVGKPARVVLDAHPGNVYDATIARIDTLAKRAHRGAPTQYFGVMLAFAQTDLAVMKPGGRVKATLVLDRQEALWVPRHAVFERDGQSVVHRWRADRFEPVRVQVGATTPGRVVIISGLEAGDRVALADPTEPLEPERTGATTAPQPREPRAR
jgi:HlyD family secretion protein